MKEVRSPIERPPIRRISEQDLFRELYRVACYFHASGSISSAEDEVGRIPALQLLAEEVQECEIVTSLLNASIRMRLLDEQLWEKSDKIRQSFASIVGTLWEPQTGTAGSDLSVREACNKIVHASDIGFFVDETKYNEACMLPRFLKPRIAVYGTRGQIAWRAEVSINGLVEAGYCLAGYA